MHSSTASLATYTVFAGALHGRPILLICDTTGQALFSVFEWKEKLLFLNTRTWIWLNAEYISYRCDYNSKYYLVVNSNIEVIQSD